MNFIFASVGRNVVIEGFEKQEAENCRGNGLLLSVYERKRNCPNRQ